VKGTKLPCTGLRSLQKKTRFRKKGRGGGGNTAVRCPREPAGRSFIHELQGRGEGECSLLEVGGRSDASLIQNAGGGSSQLKKRGGGPTIRMDRSKLGHLLAGRGEKKHRKVRPGTRGLGPNTKILINGGRKK